MTSLESVFAWRDGALVATGWAVGPWSADALQGSATGGLRARAVERLADEVGMAVGRLSFDMWRPVPRGRTEVDTEVLRDGRKAKTVQASLRVDGTEVVRCTALLVRLGEERDLRPRPAATPVAGPDEGRTIPEPIRRWSPFFTGVDTRVIRGALGVPGPAAVWFRLERAGRGRGEGLTAKHALCTHCISECIRQEGPCRRRSRSGAIALD